MEYFQLLTYLILFQNIDSRSLVDIKPKIADESLEKSRIWKLTEVTEQSQCRAMRLPDSLTTVRVCAPFQSSTWNC